MKKNKFIRHLVSLSPYLLISLLLFSGCDKIEEGEYTVYDGAVVLWEPSYYAVPAVQRVLVEKFTGPKCSNCPIADETLATIHDENVVMMSINHPTGQGVPFPNQPDLRTTGGTIWDNWYGINAIPAAYVNRDRSKQYLGSLGSIVSDINQALMSTPKVAIEMSANERGAQVFIAVSLTYVEKYTEPLTLTVALVEDSLKYKQMLPDGSIDEEYVHNHMLRKVITSYWGRDVEAKGNAGECVTGELSFEPDNEVNLMNCHLIAFVSDKKTRKVLNVATCKAF